MELWMFMIQWSECWVPSVPTRQVYKLIFFTTNWNSSHFTQLSRWIRVIRVWIPSFYPRLIWISWEKIWQKSVFGPFFLFYRDDSVLSSKTYKLFSFPSTYQIWIYWFKQSKPRQTLTLYKAERRWQYITTYLLLIVNNVLYFFIVQHNISLY